MSSAGRIVPRTPRPPNLTRDYGSTLADLAGEHAPCSPVELTFEPVLSCMSTAYVVIGIAYALFGYRCFKSSMFLTGFTFGSSIVYLICLQEYLLPPYGNVCVAVCAGVLFGLITMLIQYVGLFITGFHSGVLVAIGGLSVYDQFVDRRPQTYIGCILWLLGTGVFFAVLNLYWKKALTIFGTSLYGGALLAASLDYFIERFLMVNWVWQRAKLELPVPTPCRFSWLALATWPATTVIGLVVQFAFTATGVHHEQSIRSQKRTAKPQPRARASMLTREQREILRQQKYRYLYQVRTAHGDVISQSYKHALQKRPQCGRWNCNCNGNVGGNGGGYIHGSGNGNGSGSVHGLGIANGNCSTFQSDSTHLTVLPYEHHVHTDSDEERIQVIR